MKKLSDLNFNESAITEIEMKEVKGGNRYIDWARMMIQNGGYCPPPWEEEN